MLDTWRAISNPTDRVIACFGDSTTEGTVGIKNGGYSAILRDFATKRWGAQSGFGFYGTWRSQWTFSSGADAWDTSQGGASKSWNVGPMDGGTFDLNTKVVIGSGASKVATWNKYGVKDSSDGASTNNFTIWTVDSTGSGNFSYSVDGGPWVDASYLWANNNSLVRISINTPVESDVRIRAANSSGISTALYLVGIEPKPSSLGATVHNIGANSEFSSSAIRPSLAGWGSWIDIVKPKIATIMFTNDLGLFWDQTAYQSRIQAFIDRVKSNGGEPIVMTMCGQNGRDATNYSQQRTAHQNLATINNIIHINFFDIMGDFTTANNAGYMADNLHPSNKGAAVIAQHIWSYIGSTGNGPRFRVSA